MPVTWKEVPSEGSDDDDDDEDDAECDELNSFAGDRRFQQTLMYGQYRKELSEFAKEEAKRARRHAKQMRKNNTAGLRPKQSPLRRFLSFGRQSVTQHLRAVTWKAGGDWIFLLILGMLMACTSFIVDMGIVACTKARLWAYGELATNMAQEFVAWVSLPVVLVLFSATFVQVVAPQSIGSGIPEMKTILRGVVLKEYLTWKTLVAKIIGLTATLGSGLPLGKEGPFVHIASIVATLLSHVVASFRGIYKNESRKTEMLAAACAVGVACSFAAPIGGVLFSIEVTSVYFAVRNYWRGFFAAVSGAVLFRMLAVFYSDEETLTALFKTNFKVDFPFDLKEIFAYMFVGVVCGLLGALFVSVHRHFVLFMRRNKRVKDFLQRNRLLYPFLVTLFYSSMSFPPGFGQFVAGQLSTHHQVMDLFSNFTWVDDQHSPEEFAIVEHWRTPWTSVFTNLTMYIVFTFFWSVIASTVPVPSGIFIPVFKMGAAVGRICGETMAYANPTGIGYGSFIHKIIPGGYAIVGAAAFSGSVTHTISTSVIVFELTGQITHLLPVMIAVLISNGIASLLQPSIYDSIIRIKKLPYLPDILSSASDVYDIFVESFMVKNVKYIYYGITYRQLKETLLDSRKIRGLPLVDSPKSMVLLGSVRREALIDLLEEKLKFKERDGNELSTAWKFAAKRTLEVEAQKKVKAEDMFKRPSSPMSPRLLVASNIRRKSGSLEDLSKLNLSLRPPTLQFFPPVSSTPETKDKITNILKKASQAFENPNEVSKRRGDSRIFSAPRRSSGEDLSSTGKTSAGSEQPASYVTDAVTELCSESSTLLVREQPAIETHQTSLTDESSTYPAIETHQTSLTDESSTLLVKNDETSKNVTAKKILEIEPSTEKSTFNKSINAPTDLNQLNYYSENKDNCRTLKQSADNNVSQFADDNLVPDDCEYPPNDVKQTTPKLQLARRESRFAVTRVPTPSSPREEDCFNIDGFNAAVDGQPYKLDDLCPVDALLSEPDDLLMVKRLSNGSTDLSPITNPSSESTDLSTVKSLASESTNLSTPECLSTEPHSSSTVECQPNGPYDNSKGPADQETKYIVKMDPSGNLPSLKDMLFLKVPDERRSHSKSSSTITIRVDVPDSPDHLHGSDSNIAFRRARAVTLPKSILKKTDSFTIPQLQGPATAPIQQASHYATVHGDTTTNWRTAIDGLMRKMKPGDTPTDSIRSTASMRIKQILEKSQQEREHFEDKVYQEQVDFSTCAVDPAPFQLVERTSLLKVHSLFSLLGLSHAYVTVLGRLIGVVALKELRAAIEAINSGTPQPNDEVPATADENEADDDVENNLRETVDGKCSYSGRDSEGRERIVRAGTDSEGREKIVRAGTDSEGRELPGKDG